MEQAYLFWRQAERTEEQWTTRPAAAALAALAESPFLAPVIRTGDVESTADSTRVVVSATDDRARHLLPRLRDPRTFRRGDRRRTRDATSCVHRGGGANAATRPSEHHRSVAGARHRMTAGALEARATRTTAPALRRTSPCKFFSPPRRRPRTPAMTPPWCLDRASTESLARAPRVDTRRP